MEDITQEIEEPKPSPRQQRLLDAFTAPGCSATLKDLGDVAFKRERPAARRFSWARNQARWLVKYDYIRQIGRGTYVRVK